MVLDPHRAPRLRDRALDRLNDLTAGAAALGVIATAGLGTVAALTTHVPGVSAAGSVSSVGNPDDSLGGATTPEDATTPGDPPATSGTRSRTAQPPSNGGIVSPSTRSSGHRHATTGGS